ncbi:hypothetical protein KAI36_04993 [Paenibacillus sp. S02]|nr:hypothetical protein KAI36_04993 [Paenibacillus sp. S02]
MLNIKNVVNRIKAKVTTLKPSLKLVFNWVVTWGPFFYGLFWAIRLIALLIGYPF